VVPLNTRIANKATTLPRGGGPDGRSPVYVAKGTFVTYNVYTMHRRTDIYGPDALEFRPERWAPEEGLRPGWGYLPFNGGPRKQISNCSPRYIIQSPQLAFQHDLPVTNFAPLGICVGQQFALIEASYTIIRLLQEFRSMENRDSREWTENINLTLAIATGVKVAMVPR